MIKVFRDRGIKVHIIGPAATLILRMDCLTKAASKQLDFDECGVSAERTHASLDPINAIFAQAAAADAGVTYSLPTDFTCNSGTCSPVIEDVFIYRRDGFHLNYEGARLLSKFIHLPNA
jgi:SGNH domain (fused to AT3 domains)